MASTKLKDDAVIRVCLDRIKEHALGCGLTPEEVEELDFVMQTNYDITMDATLVQVGWGLRKWNSRRAMAFHVDAHVAAAAKNGWLLDYLMAGIKGINFLTEYFVCMLPQHLREVIDRVVLVRGDTLIAVFKNNRSVATKKEGYPSKEFLATCGLVYDFEFVRERPEPIYV